ncbi:hypothetical protein [Pseudomonas fontis]|uniref:Uncharacterized protein n=1 Tax=Pseudomonas fontis TaxID=2942633 RepID=A0ABT5P122_9PSED|nr:hypothetical protein [Pseudomonas fontis]MDD0977513.1 hypothetical protein [Pseudomonas fontis]MDD0994052.1 hypothetical protein [Pseudomonas fontis]
MPLCVTPELDRHALVEQVFPGEYWPLELKVALHDLLEQMTRAGHQATLQSLGLCLGDFMPRYTMDRAEEWQERATRRWFTHTKPALVERLADLFLGNDSPAIPGARQ